MQLTTDWTEISTSSIILQKHGNNSVALVYSATTPATDEGNLFTLVEGNTAQLFPAVAGESLWAKASKDTSEISVVEYNASGYDAEGIETLRHFTYNPGTDKLEADKAIETTLNSLFLGEQHKMSSGASNIYFTDLTKEANYHPVWGGIKDQSLVSNQQAGEGIEAPKARVFGDYEVLALGGNPVDNTSIPYDGDNFFPFNISGLGITTRVAEAVSASHKLKYELSVDGTAVYVQYLDHSGLAINQDLTWYFDHPLDIEAGSTNHASITKVAVDADGVESDIGLLLVCEGDELDGGSERYQTTVKNRRFEDKEIAYKDDVNSIVSGSVYKGQYNASTDVPSLPTGSDSLGDHYRVSVDGNGFETGDLRIFNGTSYDHIPVKAVTLNEIETSTLKVYDVYVKANYLGETSNGTALYPYSSIQASIDNAADGDSIYLDGIFNITSEVSIPSTKSLSFYGNDKTCIQYSTFNPANGDVISFDGDGTKILKFTNIKFKNAGGYGLYLKKTFKTVIENCGFENNGWNGQGLHTVLDSTSSGVLGYDSTSSELQAFYAGPNASNGGAMRVQEATQVEVVGNNVKNNLRGIRLQDCGINGYGFITRNVSSQNIESGIYLAAGSLYGCQNIVVTINSSAYNANNGLLCVGGINNKFSQNEVTGNWNAGCYNWASTNFTLRDCGLYDNNRSEFNGIGNTGDAKGSIAIGDAYSSLGTTISMNPNARFIAEILDTQVHYTGLGSNISRIGIFLTPELSALPSSSKNLIKIDDVGFIGQDHCFDFSEVDLTNIDLLLGDNSYQNVGDTIINPALDGDYYELPYSNHITNLTKADFTLNSTGGISIKEGVGGAVLNPYQVNEIQAIAHGAEVKIVLKGSNKIQFTVPVSGCSIDGTMVNSVLSQALVQLNDLFTNTTGFASGGNPVTDFTLSGDNLTLTLQDSTSYTVDVTTLGVDENKFVSSGALNGSDLELTMNDSSIITIDAVNMINGSSLPARSEDWYIAYGNNSGDVVTYASVVSAIKGKQPFYNGDFLEKGEEYVWTHEVGGSYILGIYSGTEETSDEVDIMFNNKWSTNFKFSSTNNTVRETSVGVDVGSRYASGYNISNSTLLALSYDTDNYLRLWDISSGSRVLIGESNTGLVGDSQTIFFGGDNQPNAKFPVVVKRFSEWTLVHDFDSSETSVVTGLEADSIVRSNISIEAGEKLMVNLDFAGRTQRFGIEYSGASSGVNNAQVYIDGGEGFAYGTQEQLVKSGTFWTWNTSASNYDPSGPRWTKGVSVNLGMISLVYNNDNSLDLYSEDTGEVIATKTVDLDGSPINFFYGVNEATTPSYMPSISKQAIGAGSQPITTFAPDISNQSFDITEGEAFNIQILLDANSDIANVFGEEDAPSWAVMKQDTGNLFGTAPAWSNNGDTYVINCKAANALGGITSFQVTLNVLEQTYTNTKSLNFEDGVSSYLGGNAALITSLERASNGSGAGDAWSFGLWFKGSTASSGQTVFYFGSNDVGNNGHIELRQTNHNGLKRLRLRYGTNGNYIQITTPSGSIDPTKFQHILVTYNGDETGVASGDTSNYYGAFNIYIDGVLQSTSNTHSNYGYSGALVGQNFRFGRFASGTYAKDMLYNQMAIWGSDQSANVADIYNGGVTQDLSLLSDTPEHYYEIETSTSTVQDLIGNAHLVGYNFSSNDLVDDAP